MTIVRPTRAYLYGNILYKCLELLEESYDLSVSLSACTSEPQPELRLKRGHLRARILSLRATVEGLLQEEGGGDGEQLELPF